MNRKEQMGRKKYHDQGMMMQEREQQSQDQEQEQVQENQERQFNKGGGGGGPPFLAFGATILSTSMECKPDPQDPTRQICQQVSSTQKFNPKTGQFDEQTKSSNYSPEARLTRFGNFGGKGRGGSNFFDGGVFGGIDDNGGNSNNRWGRNNAQQNYVRQNKINNQQDNISSPGFVSSLINGFRSFKSQMSNWWSSNNNRGGQGSSKGFIESPSRENSSKQSNINFQQNINSSPSFNHPLNQRFDPFEQFQRSFFSGGSLFQDQIFGDFLADEFFGRNDMQDFFNSRYDYDKPIQFYIDRMKKNDPIFDDVKSGKKNDTRFVYFKRKGKGKSETFTSEDLKKAFEQRGGEKGGDKAASQIVNEPEEYVKQQTQYQSKNNSKIYDV